MCGAHIGESLTQKQSSLIALGNPQNTDYLKANMSDTVRESLKIW